MSQQNFYPSSTDEKLQIEHKVMLLYLIDKMDIPLSNSQITKFALEENYMNYYTVQQYLSEMCESGYLDKSQDNNNTRYTITDEGLTALEAFIKHVPIGIKNRIAKYVTENRKFVKQDFDITANYFYDFDKKEYIVKCGLYENDIVIMEITLSVVSKSQAMIICNNWKNNNNDNTNLYSQILGTLFGKSNTTQLEDNEE